MSTLVRAPIFRRGRDFAREWSDTHLERPIIRAVKVGRALRSGEEQVVIFGASTLLQVAAEDVDRRRTGEMLADELSTPVAQYYGPGYSSALFAEIARMMAPLPAVRCVVVTLDVRTSHLHMRAHPVFGQAHSIRKLRAARAIDLRLVPAMYKSPPTPQAYERFESSAHDSRWNLAATIGEYRRRLRNYDPDHETDERKRLLFDYFHGEFSDGSEGLQNWRTLGERLRTLGVPVFGYRSYPSMTTGRALFGAEFTEQIEHNFALLEDSFYGGLGRRSEVPIDALPEDCYLNAADGTEHLNERGRRHLAEAIARAVRAEVK